MRRLTIVMLTLAGLAVPHSAGATQNLEFLRGLTAVHTSPEFETLTAAEPDSVSFGLYGTALVGLFMPTSTNEKLDAMGTGYGWGLFLGYRLISWLALEGEFLYFQSDYDRLSSLLIPGTASNEIKLASVDISICIRASYPIWELGPFVGGGASYIDSDLYTQDAASELFENAAGGQTAGWQAFAGFSFPAMWKWRAELGWRWIDLKQDFGTYSNGNVQLGGNMLYLAVLAGQ